MPRHYRDEVYQDKHGTWWARYQGKRQTLNTGKVHSDLLQEMKDEADRAARLRNDPDVRGLNGLELIILRGIPGSGKSTWAREFVSRCSWFKRISRDDLRQMLDGGKYSAHNEKFIKQVRNRLIRECLRDGWSVIVDDTNLKDRDIREIRMCAFIDFEAVPVRIMDFDTPLEECIRRDRQRMNPVGAERIREMYVEYLQATGKWKSDPSLMGEMTAVLETLFADED
jgi:predicted kinase